MYTKAGAKAVDKYCKKAYEDIRLRVKAGEKAPIEAAAKAARMSTNAYVIQAIKEKMERDQ